MGLTSSVPRALIQYNCIPHYRARIFELLSECKEVHFTIVADSEPDTPYLEVVDNSGDRKIRRIQAKIRTIKLPFMSHLYWQPDVLFLARELRPDVVISLGSPYSLTAWVLCIFGRIFHVPVILWGHGILSEERGPKWWLRNALYRLARGHLLYGDHAKQLLVKEGFEARNLHVVYNSLDYDLQQEVDESIDDGVRRAWRESLGVNPGEGLVVFTGRLQPVKRLDLLIEAISLIARKGKKVHVALIGEGTEKENLLTLSKKLGVSDIVHFLGPSYDERYLGVALSSCDLSVIPSGAGLSIMHAMTFGTPVLIHDRVERHFPEWEAVKEGSTGYYYKYNNVVDMAEKIHYAVFCVQEREKISHECKRIIRERYNPHYQLRLFVQAVKMSLKASRDV